MKLATQLTHSRRRGVILVLTCLSLTAILFLTALAIDSGNQMSLRRHAQNCCDAAALSGCINLATFKAQGTQPTVQSIQDAVNLSASNNNYTDGKNCTVTVNWPPKSGNFQDSNSVEVILTFPYHNLVVSGTNNVTVRSVATCNASCIPSFSMLLLEQTAADSFWVNGGILKLINAYIQVNSTNPNAAVVNGAGGSEAFANVKTAGGSSGTFSPAATTGTTPQNNPYALLPTPSKAGLTTYSTSNYFPDAQGNITLNPGYYPNGLYCINGGNVTMNPGLYYVEHGNLWINTPGTVTGNGVTLYHNGSNPSALLNKDYGLDCGIVFCPTNGNYTFNAPTSGPYAGISLFQGPNCTSTAFYDFWGSGQLICGAQYYPNSTIRCWAVDGTINCNQLVAKNFKVVGTHEIYGNSQNGGLTRLTWNGSQGTHGPTTNVALVE
jgi:Flp pilus assembly protein TadG